MKQRLMVVTASMLALVTGFAPSRVDAMGPPASTMCYRGEATAAAAYGEDHFNTLTASLTGAHSAMCFGTFSVWTSHPTNPEQICLLTYLTLYLVEADGYQVTYISSSPSLISGGGYGCV